MAFRWRADEGPLEVVPSSLLKTNVVKVGSPLTKLSVFAHELCPSTVSVISIEPVHTHCMRARIQNILSEGIVREDRNATKNGPPSAHHRNATVDNGPPLNTGLVALRFIGDPDQYC